jgi:hypothetical protein
LSIVSTLLIVIGYQLKLRLNPELLAVTITVIDPNTLVGATTSPWDLIKNATVTFVRTLTEKVDLNSGNLIPDNTESLMVPVYFKKSELVRDEGRGVPVGTYKARGYTVGILPDWAKFPTDPQLACEIHGLGSGYFSFEGKIHVVKDEVEEEGEGTQLQGYFTIQGSGANAGYI